MWLIYSHKTGLYPVACRSLDRGLAQDMLVAARISRVHGVQSHGKELERGECLKSWLHEGIIRGTSSTTMAEIITRVECCRNDCDDDMIDELDELLEAANQVAEFL